MCNICWLPVIRRSAFVGIVATLLSTSSAFGIGEGDRPPEITLPSNRGGDVHLSDLKGKVVFVDFWASWCGSCAQSIPWLSKLQESLGEKDFQVLAVNVDEERELADEFLQKSSSKLLVGYDPAGKTPEAFNVQAMPTSYLLGRDGTVVYVHEGFAPKDISELEEKIRARIGS